MEYLRRVNLSGLNISDSFAEQFSLLLSSDKKLKYLRYVNLSLNRRISSFGLKYLYSSIVSRIPEGFEIVVSSNSTDIDEIK